MPAPSASPSQLEALAWMAAVPIVAFLAVYLTSGRTRLGRPITRTVVTILGVDLTLGYFGWARLDVRSVLLDRAPEGLAWGLAVGLIAGLPIALRSQPAATRGRHGLLGALVWDAGWFGIGEGLLLNALPALAGWQAALALGASPGDTSSSSFAVAATVLAVLADHVAYPETRHWSTLVGDAVAGGALAVAFVTSGSLLAPLLGHVVIHACVILAGGEVPPYELAEIRGGRAPAD